MNRFTLKQLKYFVTVVETESIAEASRQLHIAQPSISIAIKTLKALSTSNCLSAIMRRAFPWPLADGVSTIKPKSYCGCRMSLNRIRGRIKSWFPGLFLWVALNPLRRCICQSWWPGLKMYPEITLQLYDGEQHELMHGLHRGRFDLALVYDLELGHSIHKELLNAPHKPYALLPASHPLAQKNASRFRS